MTDFVMMVEETSHMFITGPEVVKTVTGEDVSFEELGGAQAHGVKSGVAHYQADGEQDCIDFARELLSYLPSNNLDEPPRLAAADTRDTSEPDGTDAELDTLIPDSPNQPYDMHEVITHVLDDGEFLEVHAGFAPNIVVGFGRVEGASVGVVANQPMHLAGCLDIDASEKAARFVRTCDAFSIPILTFVDVPGFLPGVSQEWRGIIRRGAKLIYAYAEATVPKVTVLIPDSPNQPYDMHEVITHVLDDGEFLEVHAGFAPNIVVGFGRVEGASVGVVANQPMHLAGCLDIDASEKAARFVRTCDAFSIPILTFVDVPGFLPGVSQEWRGIIRRGAKLIYAYAEATVPKVTVITRKAYGGAYDVMGSKHLGGDVNLAWPTAQIAVMGAQGAVNILYRRELAGAGDPDALRAERITEYEDTLANPYHAAERGYVDAVIRPAETRLAVTGALRALRTKRQTLPPKKHGNIPL